MNFAAIDFETANSERSSPCSVGVVIVEGGEAVQTYYSLIRPNPNEFDPFNTTIHGITAEDVEDAPEFPEVWDEVLSIVEDRTVVAHYAAFDMSVVRWTHKHYGLTLPEIAYSCTWKIAQKAWPNVVRSLCSST